MKRTKTIIAVILLCHAMLLVSTNLFAEGDINISPHMLGGSQWINLGDREAIPDSDNAGNHRPHSSLDYQTPAAFAARWLTSAPQVTSATPQQPAPLRQASGTHELDSLKSLEHRMG